ncbi:MAG: M56 family metallopeptidase, partial [Verrucomicrobiota bacterium]
WRRRSMSNIPEFLVNSGAWTLRNSLEASVLILLVAAITFFWKKRISSRFRAILWVVVGLRLVLPFAPESAVSVFNLAQTPEPIAAAPAEVIDVTPEILPPVTGLAAADSSLRINYAMIAAAVWIVGALIMLSFAVWRQTQMRRIVHRLSQPKEPRLAKILRRCMRHSGVNRQLQLVEAAENSGVAVFGFLRPSHLIVPRGFADRYSESEIRGIFLHELAHIRRRDLLWNWVTLSIQAMHWFNPLVWWAGRQFLAERELLCDRFVLRQLQNNERRDYGLALLKTLEFAVPQTAPNPALVPFFSRKSELKHRLTMIKKSQSISPIVQALVAIVALAACAMTFTSAVAQDREGDGDRRSARDGEREGDRPREGDARRDGEREGDRPREGDARRDGEREGDRPREGDARRDGEREGDRPRGIIRDREQAPVRDGELKVTIQGNGVVIGDRQIPLVNLRRTVEESNAESAVVLAPESTPLQTVMTVLNALKDSGIANVRVGTAGRAPARDGDGDRRFGDREGDRPAEGRVMRDGEGGPAREGARDGDGDRRVGARDGEGAPAREGARDDDGAPAREVARDGDGDRRVGARDGEGAPARDGDGAPAREGARDRDGDRRVMRDGEGGPAREGARDGEGGPAREGARDGEGGPAREGARDGEVGAREGARDGDGVSREGGGDAVAMDDRKLNQLTRIYRAYDKNGDNGVSYDEWASMKSYEMTAAQRERDRGWFDQADANGDEKVTLGEWIDWKANQGSSGG